MQDFTKIRDMIRTVDSMPDPMYFDYCDCESCLFGYGIWLTTGMSNYEFRDRNYSYTANCNQVRADLFGITVDQFKVLFSGLIRGKDFQVARYDRHLICQKALECIAKWEAEQILKESMDCLSRGDYEIRSFNSIIHEVIGSDECQCI